MIYRGYVEMKYKINKYKNYEQILAYNFILTCYLSK